MVLGGMRSMWLMVLFDLPTDNKKLRKAYAGFRKSLLSDGFMMMQYSVYIRHCASVENAEVHEKRITKILPDYGEIRIIMLTDKQFSRMKIYYGKRRGKTETGAAQLELL